MKINFSEEYLDGTFQLLLKISKKMKVNKTVIKSLFMSDNMKMS